MVKTKITVIHAQQGAGKTEHMREEAITKGGLYVFACPTIELIREQVAVITAKHPRYHVEEVHSEARRKKKNIPAEIEFRRDRIVQGRIYNAILFITHEALMSADFSRFHDWHMRIDEAPQAALSGQISAGQSKDLYIQKLDFPVINGDWAQAKLKDQVSWKDTQGDDATGKHAEFFKQAQRDGGVILNRKKMEDTGVIDWFSIWSPSYLTTFLSIEIAASSYLSSLGVKAIERFYPDDCDFVIHPLKRPRTGQPNIAIHYFTDSHEGTTAFWDKSDGRRCIKEIVDYLAQNVSDLGFWSANDTAYKLMEHRVPGTYIAPKAMGLNQYRNLEKCAFIYSEKSQSSDYALKDASGIEDADIMNARESETIRQFVMRGAIRNLDYAGDYTIYLYSKRQAEMVQAHLLDNDFQSVSVAPIAAPFVTRYKPDKNTPRPLSAAEKKSKKKDQARARQQKRRAKLKAVAPPPGQVP